MLDKNKDRRIKMLEILENEWLFPSKYMDNEEEIQTSNSEESNRQMCCENNCTE